MFKRKNFDPLEPPPRWLNCPRKSVSVIVDKFVAFKVPLSTKFDKNVSIENRFNMNMLIESVKRTYNAKLGFIIDLTNTNRFYDAETEVKRFGIKYFKLNCKGHGETPTKEAAQLFMSLVETFIRQNPNDLIGVHCTHGFNRTGFLICSYLVEKLDFSIDMAVTLFAECRPPGIYKQDYIDELFNRYSDTNDQKPSAPSLPTWETDSEDHSSAIAEDLAAAAFEDDFDDENFDENDQNTSFDRHETTANATASAASAAAATANSNNNQFSNPKRKKFKKDLQKLNPEFAEPNLRGVEPCTDPDEIFRVKSLAQNICGWKGAGFPGAQPVSMDQKNIKFLYEKRYMVSWKADGTRYLMLINGRDKVYMFDRDNSVFHVRNLQFLHRKDLDRHLENTLIDGEFVLDVDPNTNQKIPRYLIYDIIKFEKDDVGKTSFQTRLFCIEKEIISARHEAIRLGKINKQLEPFSVRQKEFYALNKTTSLLSEEFKKKITHGIDGLVFQPVDEPYTSGRCESILKWKPPTMNSVDFKLVIKHVEEIGGLKEKIGELYVLGYDQPFACIKVTKAISGLDNKIIECRWHQEKWDYMRERLDKSFPNHVTTAVAVCESIKFPITEERLVEIVQEIDNRRMQQMPPPAFQPPNSQNSSHNLATRHSATSNY